MKSPSKSTYQQLELLVSELAMAHEDLRPTSRTVQTYIDTSDVRRAILGAQEYVRTASGEPRVDMHLFNGAAVLPACLLAGQFLGPFSMLAPHQAELLRQMRSHEVFKPTPSRIKGREFLSQIGIDGSLLDLVPAESLSDEQIKKHLKDVAGTETELFYKGFQCIRAPWWTQLTRLKSGGYLRQSDDQIDYKTLLDDPLLPALIDAFQKIRPSDVGLPKHLITKNNFSDAVALAMLVELTRRFNRRKSLIAPRFFDSANLFSRVALAAGIHDELSIEDEHGHTSSVLVGPGYLVCRAALSKVAGGSKLLESLRLTYTKKQDEIAPALNDNDSPLAKRTVAPLNKEVTHFIDLSFLESVWLETMAAKEFKELMQNWGEETPETPQLRQIAVATVAEAADGLLQKAEDYRRISDIWLSLRAEVSAWLSRPGAHDVRLNLHRISPSRQIEISATAELNGLLESSNADQSFTVSTSWHTMFVDVLDVSAIRSTRISAPEVRQKVEHACTMLWGIQAITRVATLTEHLDVEQASFGIAAVHIAALLKQKRRISHREIEQKITTLVRRFLTTTPSNISEQMEMAHRASSVAYLWFHLWEFTWRRDAWWRCQESDYKPEELREGQRLLSEAVRAVNLAWENARPHIDGPDEDFRARILYIANQRLYYLSELGEDGSAQPDDAFRQLSGARRRTDAWHATYHDTIARYYLLKAKQARNDDARRNRLASAITEFEKAKDVSDHDHVIQDLGAYIIQMQDAMQGPVGP